MASKGYSDVSGTNSALRISQPGGAAYAGQIISTGAIKITLPQSWTNTMMRMTVKIYTYDGLSCEINLGGYNYSGSTTWVNTFADMTTGARPPLNIRWGHDGTYCCMYIGETNTVWTYPQVFVTDFQAGFSNYDASQWNSGWSVSFATSFGTLTGGTISTAGVVYGSVGNFTGNVGIGTSSPAYKLQVAGTVGEVAEFTSSDLGTAIRINNTNAAGWGSNISFNTNGTAAGFLGSIGSLLGSTAQDLAIYATAGNGFRVYTNGNNERLRVDSAGNVGIGTSSPSYTLHVNGSVAGTSAYVNLSDKRYKKNIAPITDALSKVEQLNGVMFDWDTEKDKTINLDTKRHIGVLAQDVEQVVPEAVSTAKDGRKSVAYTDLVPLLIEAIKEQQKQINDLQQQVKQLSKQP